MSRIAFQFPHERNASPAELLHYARLADDLGYDTIFVPESWYRDAFVTAAWIAAHTSRVRIGPGIVNVYSRTPALIAQAAASLDEVSEGRAVLGLGTSGPVVIEGWHGLKFDQPLQRTRETVEIVRLALSGARVDFEGEIFRLSGFRLGFRPLRPRIPIYLATLGERSNRLTGDIGDGWMPILLPIDKLPTALREVGAQVDVAPNVPACVTSDPLEAYDLVRSHFAYYIGGMGAFYRNLVSRFGMAEQAARVHDLWQSGKRKEAVAAVSNEMLDRIAIVGTPDHCREALAAWRLAGATMPVIFLPHGAPRDVFVKTLETLA